MVGPPSARGSCHDFHPERVIIRAMHDHSAEELRAPYATIDELKAAVQEATADRSRLADKASAVREVVWRLDQGALRVAERAPDGAPERWTVHWWIQQAINLF